MASQMASCDAVTYRYSHFRCFNKTLNDLLLGQEQWFVIIGPYGEIGINVYGTLDSPSWEFSAYIRSSGL
jgi:hypothetical protein